MPKKQKKNSKQGVVNLVRKTQKKKKQPVQRPQQRHRDYFLKAMAFPEHVGPFRIPRQGSVARTVLGMDHRFLTYNNLDINQKVHGLQMGTNFDFSTTGVISTITSASPGALLKVVKGVVSGGIQFPVPASVHDANLVSGCLMVTYLGKPLDCTGELVVGVAPEIKDLSTTFDSLMLYPGSVWISMVDLMNKGSISIALRHLSPKSYEFKAPANAVEDIDTPFIIVRGLDDNSSIRVEWVRNWECRADPNQAGANSSIPYESTSGSFTQDLSAFQDASAIFATLPEVVRSTVNQGITDWMSRGKGGMFSSSDFAAAANFIGGGQNPFVRGSRIFQHIQGSGGARSLLSNLQI